MEVTVEVTVGVVVEAEVPAAAKTGTAKEPEALGVPEALGAPRALTAAPRTAAARAAKGPVKMSPCRVLLMAEQLLFRMVLVAQSRRQYHRANCLLVELLAAPLEIKFTEIRELQLPASCLSPRSFRRRVYGSGYPGQSSYGVTGRGFPFVFWPVSYGPFGYGAPYLHDDEVRCGSPAIALLRF